jgi:UPF0271 protein
MACAPREVYGYCLYQIGALSAFCRARGAALQHVKPHGALYNQAAKDAKLAEAVARAVRDAGDGIILMGLAGSEFEPAAKSAGVRFASEVFADRAYMKDGSLMLRSMEAAVIHDAELSARRAVRMVTSGKVTAGDGTEVDLKADTICLHGDSKDAVNMAAAVREALVSARVEIKPLKEAP